MPKFRCPGNKVDGSCGRVVNGERRYFDSEVVALESHTRKIDDQPCRRRYVLYKDCIEENWGIKH